MASSAEHGLFRRLRLRIWNDSINGSESGSVRVYRLVDNGMRWEQLGQDIDGEAANDWFGYSVSISADGSTVATGAPYNKKKGSYSGQVGVYRFNDDGSSWEQLGQSIYGDIEKDTFGWSINLSPDGNTLAIGSPGRIAYDRPGYVTVFSLKGDVDLGTDDWKQIGQDIVGDANGDTFGTSVSLSDDGKTLAVSALHSGRVSVYRMDYTESVWIQMGHDIDEMTEAVSLSANGNKVATGVTVYVLE